MAPIANVSARRTDISNHTCKKGNRKPRGPRAEFTTARQFLITGNASASTTDHPKRFTLWEFRVASRSGVRATPSHIRAAGLDEPGTLSSLRIDNLLGSIFEDLPDSNEAKLASLWRSQRPVSGAGGSLPS